MKYRMMTIAALLTVVAMVLAGCPAPVAPPAAPTAVPAAAEPAAAEPTAVPPTEAPAEAAAEPTAAPTEPPAEAAVEDYSDAARADTVIFDIDGGRVTSPDLWNPFVPGVRKDQGYHQAILEPLFILNYQTGEIMPWVGESFTANETNDEWTLKIRDGVEWSDGVAFTADDVVFTIQMMLDNSPDLQGSAAMTDWVKSVEKVDDLTVKFALTRPNPRFQLDYFSDRIWGYDAQIMPKHIWEGQDPLTFKFYDPENGLPLGTGPYLLDSVSETEFSYVRNDNWWGAKSGWKELPKPKKLIWTWAGPEETRAALMADDGLDSLMDITLGALQALQAANPNVITWFKDMPMAWVPDPCSRTFEFNTTVAPWDDPEMRWAINYLIDREQIVNIAYEGTTLPSKHFFPQYPPLDRYVKLLEDGGFFDAAGTAGKYPIWLHDQAKAEEIFQAKGWVKGDDGYYAKDGKQLAMTITTHEAFIEKQRIAQFLVEQFQAAGINATTRNEAGSVWGDNFNMGNFDIQMGWQACASVNEPWASMDLFNTKWLVPVGERASGDQVRWSGPDADAYSKLVDEIGVLPLGDPKIDELFVQAMDLWYKNLPMIPVTQAKKIIPFNTTYWTNWPTFENQYIHPATWWQSTHYIIQNLQPTGAQ